MWKWIIEFMKRKSEKLDKPFVSKTIAELMVELAKKEIGVEEENGSNCGPRVNEYKAATWLDAKKSWPWCFDETVDILTENGWINLKELVLSKSEIKVAQVSSENLDIVFDYPTNFISKKAENVSLVRTRTLNFICDQNHEFFASKNSKNAIPEFIKLSDVSSLINIPSCFSSAKYNSKFSEKDLDFIAAFVADGFLHSRSERHKTKIRIQVSKEKKINQLEFHEGLKNTSSKIYGKSKKSLTTFEFDVPDYFSEVFTDYKEFSWDWVFSLCPEQLAFFLERYCFWDGEEKRQKISTTRKQNADVFSTMALFAGWHPSVSIRKQQDRKDCFIISLGKKNTRTLKNKDILNIEQNTELFCVETKEGLIIVRDKRGTPFLTGNCAAFICWLVREAMKGGKFDFKRPQTAGAWDFENWAKTQPASVTLKKPHQNDIKAGDIVVFTFSHIGLAISAPDKDGYVMTIEGNTDSSGSREGGGVFQKKRHVSKIRSRIRINA